MNLLPPLRELIFFMTTALILLVIPGPAVIYIVTRSVDQGYKAGLASCGGIASGALLQVIAAAFGLSAVLASSALAYSAVRYAGAAYLVYLGIKKLREQPATMARHVRPASLGHTYGHGLLVELLNPKTALFFFAFLPQFVDAARGSAVLQFLTLGMLFIIMGFISDSLWALTAGTAAGWLQRNPAFLRNQQYVAGTVYIGLGFATAAFSSRYSLKQ